jgi:small subunit ribosomal protein S20
VANIKSQIKRIGTNEKARVRNKAAKAEVKTRLKTAVVAAETGHEDAAEYLRMAVKRLDKAAARGIIHRNQAANRKSALMHHVARVGAEAAAAAELGHDHEAAATAVAVEEPPSRSRRRR